MDHQSKNIAAALGHVNTVGVTATRKGLTDHQNRWLDYQLGRASRLRHGACVGGDETAHWFAVNRGLHIIVHPPVIEKLKMDFTGNRETSIIEFQPAKPYHERNRDIVKGSDLLLALPDGPRRPHSGTWYTVSYAEDIGVPVLVCLPNGKVSKL